MTTIEKLKALTLELRKAKLPLGPVMQFHVSEIVNIGKNRGNRETTEDETIQYLKKAAQKIEESGNANLDEITILRSFLPVMASEKEVRDFIATLENKTNKGAVMKAIRDHFGSRVDMKMASSLI
jgi:uncharacterized protein YqeY